MPNIKVSVVLPSLNVAQYVGECLGSVMRQTLKEIEILCVDAGSTDGTMEIIQACAAQDSRIRIILSERKSYGHQMNLGMDAAQGEYLGIVETDDLILPEMYEKLYEAAKANDADFVRSDYCRFVTTNGGRRMSGERVAPGKGYYGRVVNPSRETGCFNCSVNTWNGIYRLRFLRQHRIRHHESPGAAFQDNGFWFQAYMHAKRAYFLPQRFYMNRRDNPGSSVYGVDAFSRMCGEYEYIGQILNASPALRESYQYIYTYAYFRSCCWAMDRTPEEEKPSCMKRLASVFRGFDERGTLDIRLFQSFGPQFVPRLQEALHFPGEDAQDAQKRGRKMPASMSEQKIEDVPAWQKDALHVCFSIYDTSGQYSRWTGVAMASMFEHTTRKICVHLLHEAYLEKATKEKFRALVKSYGQCLQFHEVEIPSSLVSTGPPDRSTPAHYFRLKIADILPSDIHKAIYLDSDLVINLDIGSLWDLDFQGKMILGRRERKHVNPLISKHAFDAQGYVNSGVVLLNLHLIRQSHNMWEEAVAFCRQYPYPLRHFVDQDAINYVFKDEIGYIDTKFNTFTTDLRGTPRASSEEEIIYHYGADCIVNPNQFIGDKLYLEYLSKTPWHPWLNAFYAKLLDRVRSLDFDRSYTFPSHLFHPGDRVVLYGAGSMGHSFYCQAMFTQCVQIVCVIDPWAANIKRADMPVAIVQTIDALQYDYVLVAIQDPAERKAVRNNLMKRGVLMDKIITEWDRADRCIAQCPVEKHADMGITREEIVSFYRCFLGRDPEDEKTIQATFRYLRNALREKFLRSAEFQTIVDGFETKKQKHAEVKTKASKK